LQVGIDAMLSLMWLHLSTALILQMGILTIAYFVARRIIVPLRRNATEVDSDRWFDFPGLIFAV
jgi:hypothetical protein